MGWKGREWSACNSSRKIEEGWSVFRVDLREKATSDEISRWFAWMVIFFRLHLEAFTMNDGWTSFIVFLFRDPHLLKGGQWSQDWTTDPDWVFTLRWSNDLDLHCWRCQGSDFFLHTISNTRVHGGTWKSIVRISLKRFSPLSYLRTRQC